jgi:hypothetical protein
MNEEQLKEIAILAKELGFKPKTISTIITFKELFEENNKVLLSNDMCYYLLLCEIQLWLNVNYLIFVSALPFQDIESETMLCFYYTLVDYKEEKNNDILCNENQLQASLDNYETYLEALATGILEGLKLIKDENN